MLSKQNLLGKGDEVKGNASKAKPPWEGKEVKGNASKAKPPWQGRGG